MLGKLFFIGKKICFQFLILFFCQSSWSGSCYRECGKPAIFQPDKRLRRGTHDLIVINLHVNHVRRWVRGPEHPVRIDQAALIRAGKLSGNNSLENVSVHNILFCLFNQLTILFFTDIAGKINLAF